MKRLYIAAPFFNDEQIDLVKGMEVMCDLVPGIEYYSPRSEGRLMDMTGEQRKYAMTGIFNKNVGWMTACDGIIAILDHKDSGTTWELGFAYSMALQMGRYGILGFTSKPNVKLNVMLSKCLQSHAVGWDECSAMLRAWAANEPWHSAVAQVAAT